MALPCFLYSVTAHKPAVLVFALWQISINLKSAIYAVCKNEGLPVS